MLTLPIMRSTFSRTCGPDARLSYRSDAKPARESSSAMSRALPLAPGRSGVFQSRSVGPLPATRTAAGNGPLPNGRSKVPRTVIESVCQSTSELSLFIVIPSTSARATFS